jgi:uncharacterized membrane protein
LTSTILAFLGLHFFGHSEWALRIFFVPIGALIPILIYKISRYIGPKQAALPSALLATTSYFLITWSRQARSYSIQIFLMLLATLLYFYILDKKNTKKNIALYVLVAIIGIFTHPFFYLLLISHAISYLFEVFVQQKNLFKKEHLGLILGLLIILGAFVFGKVTLEAYQGKIVTLTNNLWLYHAYMWREYGMITVIGGLGLLAGLISHRKYFSPIIISMLMHFTFITFFFATATTRYLLPLFPWLFIGMGYIFATCSATLAKESKHTWIKKIMPIAIVIGIVINGYKFDIKPNRFYSVNHDFREIALIDYSRIYNIIKEKGALEQQKTAVIDTWVDRSMWYVGADYPALYNFRWIDQGIMKRTPFEYNTKGEKVLTKRTNVRFISNKNDLLQAMKRYPKGFLIVDDTSMPEDVITYANKNMKKEFFLDRYELDDNPLSNWPITLYSWGL